jgi:hypothetical protein
VGGAAATPRIVGTDVFGNSIDLTNRTTIVEQAPGR